MKKYCFIPVADYDALENPEKNKILSICNSRKASDFSVVTIDEVDHYIIEAEIGMAMATSLFGYPFFVKMDARKVVDTRTFNI